MGVEQGVIRRHLQRQVRLLHPATGAQGGPKGRTSASTGVAVPLPSAIAVLSPRPRVSAMAHGRRGWLAPAIARPLGGRASRAARGTIPCGQGGAGARVCMAAAPEPVRARGPRPHTGERGAALGTGAVPLALIGAAAGRIARLAMGRAVFPRRSDPVRRPQRPCPASRRWAPAQADGFGDAAAGHGAVCVAASARGRGGPPAHPWQPRGAAAPAWPVAAASVRRRSPSAGDRSQHRPASGAPGEALGHGTHAVRSGHRGGRRARRGGGDVPAKSCQR